MNHLNKIGFCGDLRWVHNEEGSGAKIYKSSVYFPDSITKPRTHSGITIDPGVDLGNSELKDVNEVIQHYYSEGLLTQEQISLLLKAFGKKRFEAIEWLKQYKSFFKNKFLVPELTAVYVMDKYSAPDYWLPLVSQLKGLLEIENAAVKKAVHTALLSHAYNSGVFKTIKLASVPVREKRWNELAEDIQQVVSATQALKDRRQREGLIIKSAIKLDTRFELQFADVKPRPVTTISSIFKEDLLIEFEVEDKSVITDATKVRINL